MGRKKRWEIVDTTGCTGEVKLFAWRYFSDFVYQEMLDYRAFIWRGQRCDDWKLEPTLDRELKHLSRVRQTRAREAQLKNFQFAVRGRRGPNPRELPTENDWWALGQHHGLRTPLLDWTSSPFAGAYFAFFSEGLNQSTRRAIYAVNADQVEKKSKEILEQWKEESRPPTVELVRPMADDNPRLVNQSGLFTRSPDGVDLESWVAKNFADVDDQYILLKITVPNKDRALALRSLNRMNLNHLTLFPDLYGAGKFCNMELEIDDY